MRRKRQESENIRVVLQDFYTPEVARHVRLFVYVMMMKFLQHPTEDIGLEVASPRQVPPRDPSQPIREVAFGVLPACTVCCQGVIDSKRVRIIVTLYQCKHATDIIYGGVHVYFSSC